MVQSYQILLQMVLQLQTFVKADLYCQEVKIVLPWVFLAVKNIYERGQVCNSLVPMDVDDSTGQLEFPYKAA